jgi:hypothetical protein
MLSVVCFRWTPPAGYRSSFGPETVNVLRRMVARHYAKPHAFKCVTDDATGIDPEVEIVPMWHDFATIPSPHGGHNPSCYRRLRAFAPEIADVLGPRFVAVDLDTVITGDVTTLWDRPEDFVIWGETNPRSWYNGSMFLLTAGARRQVFERFNPKTSPQQAKAAGRFGSDQGWISYCLGKGEATWTRKDGVYSYRVHLQPNGGTLPPGARMVMWHGQHDPWGKTAQQLSWVREHYQ